MTPARVGFAQFAAVTKVFGCSSRQKSQTPHRFCIIGMPTRSPILRSVTPVPDGDDLADAFVAGNERKPPEAQQP